MLKRLLVRIPATFTDHLSHLFLVKSYSLFEMIENKQKEVGDSQLKE